MSQENVEIARRLNEAGNRYDLPAILELLDPSFEWWDRKDDPGAPSCAEAPRQVRRF